MKERTENWLIGFCFAIVIGLLAWMIYGEGR